MGGAGYGCDTSSSQPDRTGFPQANKHSLVSIRAALASGREPRRDVRHVRAGVRARRHDHAYLARSAQIEAAHDGGLDLLDRAQRKRRH